MSPTTRLAINSFWEYAAFVVNSFVFLMIGLHVKADLLVKYAPLIGFGILAILLSRAIVIYGLCLMSQSRSLPIPMTWRHLLFWGGLRGSISMALALSLPTNLPAREAIVITTFGVVLFTLIVQGLSVESLVRLLKVRPARDRLMQYERLKARLIACNTASQFLKEQHARGHVSGHAYERLNVALSRSQELTLSDINDLHLSDKSLQEVEILELSKRLLEIEKDCYIKLTRDGVLEDELFTELKLDADRRIQDVLDRELAVLAELESQDASQPATSVSFPALAPSGDSGVFEVVGVSADESSTSPADSSGEPAKDVSNTYEERDSSS